MTEFNGTHLKMNRRILIADDDRIQIRLLQKILGADRYRNISPPHEDDRPFDIESFEDGAPLAEFFEQEFRRGRRIPVCILDMRMMKMGGLETAEAVRKIDPEVFIIIITSHEEIKHRDLMKSLKKDVYFMRKPLRTEELMAMVDALVINWNNQQALKAAYREKDRTRIRLQTILNHSPTIIVQQDLEGRYKLVNRRFTEVFGMKSEDILGRTDAEIFPASTAKVREKRIREAIDSAEQTEFEEQIPVGGSIHTYLTVAYPILDENGRIEGVGAMSADITDRKAAEIEIREKENYLKTIMNTIQAGVIIIEPETYRIIDVNPCSSEMLGYERDDLIGRDFYDFRYPDINRNDMSQSSMVSNSYSLKTRDKKRIHVRRSLANATSGGREYLVQSMLDITDIQQLLKKQEISIDIAKNLLFMINGMPPRLTTLSEERALFFEGLSAACLKEGGDHFFIRNVAHPDGFGKTAISLKDQSGHEVGCVLRSIATDLIHHEIITNRNGTSPAEIMVMLDKQLAQSRVFGEQDFFTSVYAEIDHRTLEFRYVSNGHPKVLLIRGDTVSGFPDTGAAGGNMPIPISPDASFSEAAFRLETGDKLIFYTDGLVEMPRTNGSDCVAFDDLKRMVGEIIAERPQRSASDIMHHIVGKISETSGVEIVPFSKNTSFDDVTVICLEIEDLKTRRERTLKPKSAHRLCEMADEIIAEILPELEARGFRSRDMAVRSIMAEGIMNAWNHGNQCDTGKTITIGWRFGNDFHLDITDQGNGFDLARVPDPKADENLLKASGRGVYIIKKFSDNLRWEEGGRRLAASIKKYPAHNEPRGKHGN